MIKCDYASKLDLRGIYIGLSVFSLVIGICTC